MSSQQRPVSSIHPPRSSARPLVAWLDAAEPDIALVGGKAASLARLNALGAPVPLAFALTTSAWEAFSTYHSLPRRVAGTSPGELKRLRARIAHGALPEPVADAIDAAWQELTWRAGGSELAVAVRSSGTAEDSAAFSFAGLHDTVLDVRTPATLEAAIRTCWSSLWSDRAIAYRLEGGLAGDIADIAVVVQQLVRSDVSFVAFTADPISGNGDVVVIDAAWGLGEGIVSGLVVPDHVTVGADGHVTSYAIGSKRVMVIPGGAAGGGTREVPVPRALQAMAALSHDQASAIAALGRRIAGRLGYPADLEGGIAGGVISLFQARPITTLPA